MGFFADPGETVADVALTALTDRPVMGGGPGVERGLENAAGTGGGVMDDRDESESLALGVGVESLVLPRMAGGLVGLTERDRAVEDGDSMSLSAVKDA